MKTKYGEKINFRDNFREYLSLVKKHKVRIFVLLLISLVVEGLLVVDKFLFKSIIDNGTEFVAGNIGAPEYTTILMVIAGIYIGVILVRPIFKWFSLHLTGILDSDLLFDLKEKYFSHLIYLSHDFHSTHKTGTIISRLNRGAGAVESMTDIFVFNMVPIVIQIVVVSVSLAYFNLVSALVIFLITISFILYSLFIQNIQQEAKIRSNRAEDIEKGMISDVFLNIDSIKYFGKENYIKKRYEKLRGISKEALIKYWNYYRWFDSGQIFILGIGTFFLLFFPLQSFLAGELTLGTLVFIYTIYGNVIGPVFGFVYGIRGYYRAMADFQELFEYSKIENEIKDDPGAKNLIVKRGIIDFDGISFTYKKRNPLFKNFSLKIKEDEKVALVGHSGSGKTTLVKLLYRFYDVNLGSILIDGKNIKDFKQESVRSELSIVPQEAILFDDTIYNNIKFSKPNASREEVLRAIKFAQLDKLIESFPQKEKTIVGERGVKLSGGEKQRVSIARAILANKKVLVLDEATSSLDSETEHEIQKDLQRLLKGRTSIIIAHRLSTIMGADKIVVMKKGKIVQMGKHRELIRKDGEYRRLWNLQKGGYIK